LKNKRKKKDRESSIPTDPKSAHSLETSQWHSDALDGIFLAEINQLQHLLEGLNKIRKCEKEGCTGILVISSQRLKGLGGAAKFEVCCNGCGEKTIFESSSTIPGTDRKVIPTQVMLS